MTHGGSRPDLAAMIMTEDVRTENVRTEQYTAGKPCGVYIYFDVNMLQHYSTNSKWLPVARL